MAVPTLRASTNIALRPSMAMQKGVRIERHRFGAVRQHRQLLGIHARAAVDRRVDRSPGLTHG